MGTGGNVVDDSAPAAASQPRSDHIQRFALRPTTIRTDRSVHSAPRFQILLANDSLNFCASERASVTIKMAQDAFISLFVRDTNDLFSSRRRLARHVISAFFFVPRNSKRVCSRRRTLGGLCKCRLAINETFFAFSNLSWVDLKSLQQKLICILAIVRSLLGKSRTGSS